MNKVAPVCCSETSTWVDNGGKCQYFFCRVCRTEVMATLNIQSYDDIGRNKNFKAAEIVLTGLSADVLPTSVKVQWTYDGVSGYYSNFGGYISHIVLAMDHPYWYIWSGPDQVAYSSLTGENLPIQEFYEKIYKP